MKNIKLLFTLVLMTITVLGTSCSDWLDDISPRHAIPQSALTDDDLEKLLNGVYATMENYTFTFWWLDDIQGKISKQVLEEVKLQTHAKCLPRIPIRQLTFSPFGETHLQHCIRSIFS